MLTIPRCELVNHDAFMHNGRCYLVVFDLAIAIGKREAISLSRLPEVVCVPTNPLSPLAGRYNARYVGPSGLGFLRGYRYDIHVNNGIVIAPDGTKIDARWFCAYEVALEDRIGA